MAKPAKDTQTIVFSIIVAVSITFALVIAVLIFASLPTFKSPSSAGVPPEATAPAMQADARTYAEPPPPPPPLPANPDEPRSREPTDDNTPFGLGAADDFEDGNFRFGRGQWYIRGWGVSGSSAETRPKVVTGNAHITPDQGTKMAQMSGNAKIERNIALRDAQSPRISFAWAVAGLQEGETAKFFVSHDLVLTLDRATPENTWQYEVVDLSPYTGGLKKAIFRIDGSAEATLYVDDIRLWER